MCRDKGVVWHAGGGTAQPKPSHCSPRALAAWARVHRAGQGMQQRPLTKGKKGHAGSDRCRLR